MLGAPNVPGCSRDHAYTPAAVTLAGEGGKPSSDFAITMQRRAATRAIACADLYRQSSSRHCSARWKISLRILSASGGSTEKYSDFANFAAGG